MAEEETQTKLAFANADELTDFLMDLQGQIVNIQETVDKLAPAEESEPTEETEESAETEETATETEEPTEEEINEIDALLQTT